MPYYDACKNVMVDNSILVGESLDPTMVNSCTVSYGLNLILLSYHPLILTGMFTEGLLSLN